MAYSPWDQGYVNPTDAKRWLSQYAMNQSGFDESWRQYMPSVARFFEGDISDIFQHVPRDIWANMESWLTDTGVQGLGKWGEENPNLYTPPTPDSFQWMNPDWWNPERGGIYNYTPQQTPPPPEDQKRNWYKDKIMERGIMGNLIPGMNNSLLPQLPQTPPMPDYGSEQQQYIPYQNTRKWKI